MSSIATIRDDLNAVRKARNDPAKVSLLTTLLGEAVRVGKDAGNRETTDAETLAVVRKFVKNANQSLSDLEKVGRDTGSIRREMKILEGYLPASVAEADVEKAVREIAGGMEGGNPKAMFGIVVKGLKERFGDAFDGSAMMPVVKRILED